MTDCGEIHLLLGPYADGEVEPHEIAVVEAHLAGCAVCPSALSDYRALGAGLRELPPPLVPPDFARIVTKRIARLYGGWRVRLAQFRESMGALGAAFEVVAVGAVAALLTVFVAEPYMRTLSFHHRAAQPMQLAHHSVTPPVVLASTSRTAQHIRARPVQSPQDLAGQTFAGQSFAGQVAGDVADADAAAALDSQEVVSALGGGVGPSVAVWNEPRTDTTVVWVPR